MNCSWMGYGLQGNGNSRFGALKLAATGASLLAPASSFVSALCAAALAAIIGLIANRARRKVGGTRQGLPGKTKTQLLAKRVYPEQDNSVFGNVRLFLTVCMAA
jgi:hypothetical protein